MGDGHIKDMLRANRELITEVMPFTMTGAERIFHLIQSIRYLEANRIIESDLVECGVWRGGSMRRARNRSR